MSVSAEEFREYVGSGEVPADSHDRLLRIAFVDLDARGWDGDGVFDVVEELHTRRWSFGQGDLQFNRYDFQVELVFPLSKEN